MLTRVKVGRTVCITMSLPQLTKHDAAVIILKCMIQSTERLFDERFDESTEIRPNDLKTLREARDTQVERLRSNLKFILKG